MKIPMIIYSAAMLVFLNDENASGMRCIIASPKSAPTAKLTKKKIDRSKIFLFIERAKMPTREIRLTTRILANVYRITDIGYKFRFTYRTILLVYYW